MTQLLVNCLKLAATATAPRCARMFVNHTLRSWLLAELVDDAELIVSELATNAAKATGTLNPHPTYADLEELAILAVRLRVTGDSLFIEVWDCDRANSADPPPTDKDPDEGGRGLRIVAALSKRYGTSTLLAGGKIVWAELDAGHGITTVCQKGRCRRLPPQPQPINTPAPPPPTRPPRHPQPAATRQGGPDTGP